MTKLKKISKESVPRAIEKAERYRLLNEPGEAASICLDVLDVDPDNQQATVILLLALTDRFGKSYGVGDPDPLQLVARLKGDYERVYYEGIVWERRAKIKLQEASHGSRRMAYEWITRAMQLFAKAEELHPSNNEDAILRWNTCARIIERNNLADAAYSEQDVEQPLE